jgi:beta-glucosidase
MVCFLVTLVHLTATSRADSDDDRARQILAQMTLREKIDYLGGIHAMSIRPIPRLGLPEIRMSDGPLGVRQDKPSTRYPAGIALAASWDQALAEELGISMARDCRARGIHILLAPGININRVPNGGRNFEYISGEDPYLASRLVVSFIRGVQGQGVLATAKHFAANNQEFGRMNISAEVDERTLREIYLPAFRAAVEEAHVGAVMDAYNRVNGVYCTENDWLNNQILKGEWRFDGILMSDWGATHSVVPAVIGDLDLEMPSGQFLSYERLLPALADGIIQESQIEDKVLRILRTIIRMGFLDRDQKDSRIPENDPHSAETARKVAEQGIVLLKNEHQLLPLDRANLKSVAVFGPDAHPGVPTGWGSSFVKPFHAVSMVDGLRQRLGAGVKVDFFAAGVGNFATSKFEHQDQTGEYRDGLKGEYFDNATFYGEPTQTRVDSQIDFDWSNSSPSVGFSTDRFTIRWTGVIRPDTSGLHIFRERSDDAMRVFLDGAPLIDDWQDHAPRTAIKTRYLEGGKTYKLQIEFRNQGGGAVAQFAWAPVAVPDAVKDYDAAIVCVGFDEGSEGESFDRTFALPEGQDELVHSVADKNRNTIVVLYSGGNVDTRNWLSRVPALLHAWYPGQEGGSALAEILLGEVNPSGKLPVTFGRRPEDDPAFASYPSRDGGQTVHYNEGIFVGYRGYDRNSTVPLFPFGYGLSYTRFDYSDLQVRSKTGSDSAEAASRRVLYEVAFKVVNSGDRPGAEVAQLYIHPIDPPIERPLAELKGFAKVHLEPGETKVVVLSLDQNALAYFDPAQRDWEANPGAYEIEVGASSRDIRLRQRIDYQSPVRQQSGASK